MPIVFNLYARLLRADSPFFGPATARGTVGPLGPYPAFEPGPGGEVAGELDQMRDPEFTLAALDAYEGGGCERIVIRVNGPSGERDVRAYARQPRE